MAWPWQTRSSLTKESLLDDVIAVIQQLRAHSGDTVRVSIHPASFLGADLGLSSIAVVRLAGALQKRYGRKRLLFHTLWVKPDGTMLQDVRVSDVVSLLERHLGAEES